MTENEAINELKDYRACSGTELPTEIEAAIKALEEIQQYRAIGTTAEIIGQQYELQTYQAIGTVEEFKALKEKSAAKKVVKKQNKDDIGFHYCPNCNHLIGSTIMAVVSNYCENCGQSIDWE